MSVNFNLTLKLFGLLPHFPVKWLWQARSMSVWECKEELWEWITQGQQHLWHLFCQRDLVLEVGTELKNLSKVCVFVCVCVGVDPICLTMWSFSSLLKIGVECCLACDYDQYLSKDAVLNMICMEANEARQKGHAEKYGASQSFRK